MEFIGGFLVAVFIYVYGSYCGFHDIGLRTFNGKSSRDRSFPNSVADTHDPSEKPIEFFGMVQAG
jgi:hypothetical protein